MEAALPQGCRGDGFSIVGRVGRQDLDVAYISAISALAGSVIGGLTSGYTTWLTQRSQAGAGMVAHDLARREVLVIRSIIETCFVPNRTVADLRRLVKSPASLTPSPLKSAKTSLPPQDTMQRDRTPP
jgi:hypothetical protein